MLKVNLKLMINCNIFLIKYNIIVDIPSNRKVSEYESSSISRNKTERKINGVEDKVRTYADIVKKGRLDE